MRLIFWFLDTSKLKCFYSLCFLLYNVNFIYLFGVGSLFEVLFINKWILGLLLVVCVACLQSCFQPMHDPEAEKPDAQVQCGFGSGSC